MCAATLCQDVFITKYCFRDSIEEAVVQLHEKIANLERKLRIERSETFRLHKREMDLQEENRQQYGALIRNKVEQAELVEAIKKGEGMRDDLQEELQLEMEMLRTRCRHELEETNEKLCQALKRIEELEDSKSKSKSKSKNTSK